MNPEPSDKLFRDRLYDMESEVPEAVWSQVESRLQPRSGRRWMFLLLLLPLGLMLSYVGSGSDAILAEIEPEQQNIASKEKENDFSGLKQVPATDVRAEVFGTSEESVSGSVSKSQPSTQPVVNALAHQQDAEVRRSFDRKLVQMNAVNASKLFAETALQNDPATTAPSPINTDKSSSDDLARTPQLARPFDALMHLDHAVKGFRDPKLDICPTFSAQKKRLVPFVELAIQAGRPIRMLDARSAEFDDYRALRENSEHARYGFEVRGLAGLEIGRHLEVKSGIGFRQINEVFDYVDESASRTIVNIITDTVFNGGVPTIISDTSVVREYGQRIKRSNNRLRFLEIPIIGGYRFEVGKHRFLLSGGVALQLAFGQKGDVLAPDKTIVPIDHKQSDSYLIFKAQAGMDILTNVGYEFHLDDLNALTLLASFRWPTAELTHTDYPLLQKYSSVQLGLALKHRFR